MKKWPSSEAEEWQIHARLFHTDAYRLRNKGGKSNLDLAVRHQARSRYYYRLAREAVVCPKIAERIELQDCSAYAYKMARLHYYHLWFGTQLGDQPHEIARVTGLAIARQLSASSLALESRSLD